MTDTIASRMRALRNPNAPVHRMPKAPNVDEFVAFWGSIKFGDIVETSRGRGRKRLRQRVHAVGRCERVPDGVVYSGWTLGDVEPGA